MGHFFLHTRIHPSPLPAPAGTRIYLKREDEAGYAVSGGKVRKMASLLPYLLDQGYREVAVIGSLLSNNVLAASQFLLEYGIRPTLFLKAARYRGPGNAFLTELLVPRSGWRVLSAEEWPRVEEIASEYASAQPHPVFVLPEGAFCAPALPGTLGLYPEIQAQEEALGLRFGHVFIDSGTGLSAAGLILGGSGEAVVHVVHMAMDAAAFEARLSVCREWSGLDGGLAYRSHIPQHARSFGSVNAGVLADVRRFAREYGLLTDPVYSAKLLRESLRIIGEEAIGGPVLLVHSGGCATLPGFYDRLREA